MKTTLVIPGLIAGVGLVTILMHLHSPTLPRRAEPPTFAAPPRVVYVTNYAAGGAALPPLRLETANLARFVAEARARGLSEAQIRAIARAEWLTHSPKEFWQTRSFADELREKAAAHAEGASVDSALAAAGLSEDDGLGFVTDPNDRAALRQALAPLESQRHDIELRNSGGAWSQDDRDAYNQIFDQMNKATERLLPKDQAAQWQARQTLPEAERLRHLAGFQFAGPEEFTAAFTIGLDFAQRRTATENLGDLAVQREAAFKALLGEQRYAEFQRAQDASYANEVEWARRQNLPDTYSAWLFDLRTQFDAYERQLSDSGLSEAQVQSQLAAMREKCRSGVAQYLSHEAVEDYLEGGGYWLRP